MKGNMKGNMSALLLALLLFAQLCFAQFAQSKPLPIIGDWDERLEKDAAFKEAIYDTFHIWKSNNTKNVTLENLGEKAVIVVGSELNALELGTLESLKQKRPALARLQPIKDEDTDAKALAASGKLIILIGGPSQNSITRQFFRAGWLQKDLHEFRGQIIFNYGETPSGAPILAISDGRGYKNLKREGGLLAPVFSRFIPKRIAPFFATIAGMGMLAVPLVAGVALDLAPGYLRTYLGKYLQFLGKGENTIKKASAVLSVLGYTFKVREILSIFLAASVFAVGMTYLFLGPDVDLFSILLLDLAISCALYYSRELTRILLSQWQKLETEFHFWIGGSFITLASAALGALCNATYFILEEKGEDCMRKSARIKIFVEIATICAAAFFFLINLASPDSAWQMFSASASTLGAIEILPISPLPGYGIRKWSEKAWLATFSAVWIGYILINFVL